VPELFERSAANLRDSKQNASSGNLLGRTNNTNMKILNTTCRLESQRDALERYPKPQAAITPHILCISLLALLTGCTLDLAIKPDKAPPAITGNNRPVPTGPVYPTYPIATGPVYPDPTIGGFQGAQLVSNPTWAN
jgi:hypothetical protein